MNVTTRIAPTGRRLLGVVTAAALSASLLAACGQSGGAGEDAGPAKAGDASAVDAALEAGGTLTYWSWTPQTESQVAAFEKAYPQVDVEWVNVGTGNDHYTQMQNAIKAGSGAPDVAQVEYYALPQFVLSESLVDLTQYGFGDLAGDYSDSTWGSVALQGGIYGLPQDSGPMAMFYNAAVFEKNGVEVPTTWEEYVAAAKKLKEADPDVRIASDTGDAGFATSMIWQAGGKPFAAEGTDITVNLQDEGSKRWADTWNQLVSDDLLGDTPAWSDEWYQALGDGSIATLVTGAWMPGVLESSVPDSAGDWRVAPIPTYDGTPVNAENGGGGTAVLAQSENAALAAGFVRWLNNSEESRQIYVDEGGFPSAKANLEDPKWRGYESEYFGGQKINEVLGDSAATVVPGWSYLPYQVYGNSVFGDTVGQSYVSGADLNAGLTSWQDNLVKYGQDQGFTVNGG